MYDWCRNGEIVKATIRASDAELASIAVTGERGVAVFDNFGRLHGSPALSLNDDGKLLLPDIFGDVNVHNNVLRNAVLESVVLRDVKEAHFKHLSLAGGARDSIGVFGFDGELSSSGAGLQYDSSTGTLEAKQLGSFKLTGPADMNGQELKNPSVIGGTIRDLRGLETTDLTVTSIATAGAPAVRLVGADSMGKIGALTGGVPVSLQDLSVNSLTVSGSLDLTGAVVRGAKLDPGSTDFGVPSSFEVGSLRINSLTHAHPGVAGNAVGAVLTVSASGHVAADGAAHVQDLSVSQKLTVSDQAGLIVKGLPANSLLTVDNEGKVVSTDGKKDAFSLHSIRASEVSMETMTATAAIVQSLSVSNLAKTGTPNEKPTQPTSVVTVGQDWVHTNATQFYLQGLIASDVEADGSLTAKQLTLKEISSLVAQDDQPQELLTIDKAGHVTKTADPTLTSLQISESLKVKGQLLLSGLAGAIKDSESLVSVDTTGALRASKRAAVEQLTVSQAFESLGTLDAKELRLSGTGHSNGLLEVSDGNVKSTLAPKVTTLEADKLTVNTISAQHIHVTDNQLLNSKKGDNDYVLLQVTSSGDVNAVSAASIVHKLIAEQPPVANGKYETLNVQKDLTVENLHFSSGKPSSQDTDGLLAVDATGKVGPLDKVRLDRVTVKNIDVTESMLVTSLSLRQDNSGPAGTAGTILSIDHAGKVAGAAGISHTQGILSVPGLRTQSLQGQIDAQGVTLTKPRLENAHIENSEIVIPQSVAFGNLVVRSQVNSYMEQMVYACK
jgi:hypothetical protein